MTSSSICRVLGWARRLVGVLVGARVGIRLAAASFSLGFGTTYRVSFFSMIPSRLAGSDSKTFGGKVALLSPCVLVLVQGTVVTKRKHFFWYSTVTRSVFLVR